MMNSIRTAALLNNEAISLFMFCASAAQPVRKLRTALATLNDMNKLSYFQNIPTAGAAAQSSPLVQIGSSEESASKLTTVSSVDISNFSDDAHLIVNRLFLLNADDKMNLTIHLCNAVITFNIALILHLRHKSTLDRAPNKALRLYDLTLSILEEMPTTSAFDHGVTMLVRSAALNNKAVIHYEQCDFEQAQTMFDLLQCSIKSSAEHGSPLDTKDIENLLLNIVAYKAPAAAQAA